MYLTENVTSFDTYLDLKSPEKEKKKVIKQQIITIETKSDPVRIRGSCKHYKDAEKENLFELVYLKGMSVRSAALKLNIKPCTANNWTNDFEKEPKDFIERKSGNGRHVGRPPILNDEHKEFLIDMVDENTSPLTLDDMMKSLTTQFGQPDIVKTAFYNSVTKKCSISLKRIHFHLLERNNPDKIEERYQWVSHWMKTDMDYISNCVFIDENNSNHISYFVFHV
jgi:transposase